MERPYIWLFYDLELRTKIQQMLNCFLKDCPTGKIPDAWQIKWATLSQNWQHLYVRLCTFQLWFHRSTDTRTQYDWVYVYLLLFHTKDFGQHRSNLHFTAAPLGNLLATWPLVCRSMSDTYTLTWWTDFDFDAINRLKWISSVSSQQVLVLVSMNLLFGLWVLKSVSIHVTSLENWK